MMANSVPRRTTMVISLLTAILCIGSAAWGKTPTLAELSAMARVVGADEDGGSQQSSKSSIWRPHVRSDFGAWFPSLGGEVTIGGAAANSAIRVETELGLSDNEATPLADLSLSLTEDRFERWELWLDVFGFDTEGTGPIGRAVTIGGTGVAAGTLINNDFSVTSVGGHASYDLFGNLLDGNDNGGIADQNASLHIEALGGLRAINVDHRLAVGGGGPVFDYDEWNAALQGGGRLKISMRIPDAPGTGRLDVSFAALAGTGVLGDADLSTIDLWVAARYMLSEHLGLNFGYRHLDFDVEDDRGSEPRYNFDGQLRGIFFGATVEF